MYKHECMVVIGECVCWNARWICVWSVYCVLCIFDKITNTDTQCWTSDHVWYLVPSYISMVVYVIGIPVSASATYTLRRYNHTITFT